MTEKKLNKIYDILVGICNARKSERDSFVYNHMKPDYPYEWRFGGHLGYGGKFWRLVDTSHPIHEMVKHSPYYVTCYSEDETPDVLHIMEIANNLLKKVYDEKD